METISLQLDDQLAAQLSTSERRLPSIDANGSTTMPATTTTTTTKATTSAATATATTTTTVSRDPTTGAVVIPRRNGLQYPYSRDQVISCLGHLVSAICFTTALCLMLSNIDKQRQPRTANFTLSLLLVHGCTMLLLVIAWMSCSSIDPSLPVEQVLPHGWFGIKLQGPRWAKTRYCALCRKHVPGLDHHCTWLQTCVGRANYAQFFTIACCGNIQFLMQVVVGVMFFFNLMGLRVNSCSNQSQCNTIEGLMGTSLAISVPCSVMYGVLLGFHALLSYWGYGTYDWMLKRRRRQRERLAKRRAAAQAETDGTINGNGLMDRPGVGAGAGVGVDSSVVTSRPSDQSNMHEILLNRPEDSNSNSQSSRNSRRSSGTLTSSVAISIEDPPVPPSQPDNTRHKMSLL